MRSPPDKYALAEDDPKTPEEKRGMGKKKVLADSRREQLDICNHSRGQAKNPTMARKHPHSAACEGKGQSKPV
ncbi:hypothetical protein KDH_61290 [Dictyobacter sp. S3.2.2.5]|uniref:Uncharacterized protein n=1 Tax=Dictyobacter halimunensis TaxID=3026934 RepID=A0ABQ6G075_9CHLR|nr:hypothetical protein KDH_61290 [Dictyobacter sp. S3.2.2.5]